MNKQAIGITIAIVVVTALVALLWWAGANEAGEPSENGSVQNAPLTETNEPDTADEDEDANAQMSAPTEPAIAVNEQRTDVSAVTVARASLPESGYIVIHEDEEGQPGAVIGRSDLLAAAFYEGFTVMLNRDTESGETLYAMLHTDNGDGVYDFPGPDAPTRDADNLVVVTSFTIGEARNNDMGVDTTINAELELNATNTPE